MIRRRGLVALLAVLLVAGCGGDARPSAGEVRSRASRPAADLQPTTVTFDTPEGFVADDRYFIVVPLHPLREARWRRPSGEGGYDVVFVVSYVLERDATGESTDQLLDRVRRYAKAVKARRTTEPELVSVAGYDAWQHEITQPYSGGDLTYQSTYVFAGPYLVQVGCQWREQRELVLRGCRTVLDTLRIGAV